MEDNNSQKNIAPLLSICIPSYNRPVLLQRALASITKENKQFLDLFEIVISDDSTDSTCKKVVQDELSNWPGHWLYTRNDPSLGMAKNWNSAVNLSSGQYILILHDDDYMAKQGLKNIIEALNENTERKLAILFGVKIVNLLNRTIKVNKLKKQYLAPEQALEKLLFDSSFVRFPGIILHGKTFSEIGGFDEEIGEISDLDMWLRLFSAHGIWCESNITAYYTVHQGALTANMFQKTTIEKLSNLFDTAKSLNVLSVESLERCKSNFFHQFILAGAFRSIKQRNFRRAKHILGMFENMDLSEKQVILKWRVIRFCLELLLYRIP